MICKERDASQHADNDIFSQAGAKAEEQMAFYLRREFGADPEVWVFNDLRFEEEERGDAAQIDHLILHRSGFILVESKSVTSKVRARANGEWERIWNNHWQGMSSPIKQGQLQAKFLRAALQSDAEKLLGKFLFGQVQMRFGSVPIDSLVAISDRGSIEREGEVPEVMKADLVGDRIREIVQRHKKARRFLGLASSSYEGLFNFSDVEVQALTNWLTGHHCPRLVRPAAAVPPAAVVREVPASYVTSVPPVATPQPPVLPVASVAAPVAGLGKCEKCGGQSEILWGKFGYYWKCPACGTNMPIKEYCPGCRGKLKLRKDKTRFYKYCEPCKSAEQLYHEAH